MNPRLRTPLFALSFAGSLLISCAHIRSSARGDRSVGRDGRRHFPCRRCASLRVQTRSSNKLVWQFREPIAALMLDGKTVGRHYAGPNWQHVDGSAVRAKMVSSLPGATSNDVPWLKLEVTEQRGNGTLSHVATVQRINTKGGVTQGPCETAGTFRSVPYSADYVFLRKDE